MEDTEKMAGREADSLMSKFSPEFIRDNPRKMMVLAYTRGETEATARYTSKIREMMRKAGLQA